MRNSRKQLKEKIQKWWGDFNVGAMPPERISSLLVLFDQYALLERSDELKACLHNVPMPTLSYEQVEGRIKYLRDMRNV